MKQTYKSNTRADKSANGGTLCSTECLTKADAANTAADALAVAIALGFCSLYYSCAAAAEK